MTLSHQLTSQTLMGGARQRLRQDICQLFGRWDPLELYSLGRDFVVNEGILRRDMLRTFTLDAILAQGLS